MVTTRLKSLRLVWLAFFLSGVAGLSYELVWVRHVGRAVGGSTAAVATTVAIFLAGLALGAALFGRLFDRTRRPFHRYALLEVAIATSAALVPPIFALAEKAATRNANPLVPFLLTSIIMLPSTVLLGGTFPAMAAVLSKLRDEHGHIAGLTDDTSRFYGINTLGAMVGCLLTSFVLLPLVGHGITNLAMVTVNTIVALTMWLTGRPFEALRDEDLGIGAAITTQSISEPSSPRVANVLSRPLALTLAGLSGFFAIGVEVLWTRTLAVSFPVTVYVFAVVLAAYLAGIALGSLLLPLLTRRHTLEGKAGPRLLLFFYLITAIGVLISALLLPRLSGLFFYLVGKQWIGHWAGYISGIGLSAFFAMVPATLAMGAALPLLIGLSGSMSGRSREAGQVYGTNILGGVLGSMVTTFLIMPAIGLSASLGLMLVGYVVLCAALLRPAGGSWRSAIAVAGVALLLLLGVVGGWSPDLDPDRKGRPGKKLLYAKDTPSGTITIYEQGRAGGVPIRSLEVNGFYGLNITNPSSVAMQYGLGHLPIALHGDAKHALLIGFATGNTLAAMGVHKLDQLDCVEIHSDLLQLAPYFKQVNQEVWKKPGVHLHAGDGRRFVLAPGPRYDLIVGDLFLPRSPGVGALFSLDHFQSVYVRLKPLGLYVAWLPLWQLSPWEVGVIIRTFREVFPQAQGVLSSPERQRPALGLLGFHGQGELVAGWEDRAESWVRAQWRSVYGSDLPAGRQRGRLLLGPAELARWAEDKPLNSLEHPVVEYSAPKTLANYQLRHRSLAEVNLRVVGALTSTAKKKAHH